MWCSPGSLCYVFLSCVGAAVGMLTLLDLVPNARHGLVTAVSFFLNVALGAGVGPVAVGFVQTICPRRAGTSGVQFFLIACPGFLLVTGFSLIALRNARRRQSGHSNPHISAA